MRQSKVSKQTEVWDFLTVQNNFNNNCGDDYHDEIVNNDVKKIYMKSNKQNNRKNAPKAKHVKKLFTLF